MAVIFWVFVFCSWFFHRMFQWTTSLIKTLWHISKTDRHSARDATKMQILQVNLNQLFLIWNVWSRSDLNFIPSMCLCNIECSKHYQSILPLQSHFSVQSTNILNIVFQIQLFCIISLVLMNVEFIMKL